MRRFLTPRWLAAHVVVLAVVVVCASLGFWQLRRLEERRALNSRIEARGSLPAEPIPRPDATRPGELLYRPVEVRGVYDTDREVLVAGRSLGGRPGHHVLTPLVTEEGWGVVVERGWVPFELDRPPVAGAAPPDGVVRVVGVVLRSEDAGTDGPAGGVLRRPDVAAIAGGLDYPVHPDYVRLQHQDPPQEGGFPVAVGPPETTEGPHLGYAVQWFLFGGTAIGVYLALAWREARRGRRSPHPAQPRIRDSR